jgi:hypothetical protein
MLLHAVLKNPQSQTFRHFAILQVFKKFSNEEIFNGENYREIR